MSFLVEYVRPSRAWPLPSQASRACCLCISDRAVGPPLKLPYLLFNLAISSAELRGGPLLAVFRLVLRRNMALMPALAGESGGDLDAAAVESRRDSQLGSWAMAGILLSVVSIILYVI